MTAWLCSDESPRLPVTGRPWASRRAHDCALSRNTELRGSSVPEPHMPFPRSSFRVRARGLSPPRSRLLHEPTSGITPQNAHPAAAAPRTTRVSQTCVKSPNRRVLSPQGSCQQPGLVPPTCIPAPSHPPPRAGLLTRPPHGTPPRLATAHPPGPGHRRSTSPRPYQPVSSDPRKHCFSLLRVPAVCPPTTALPPRDTGAPGGTGRSATAGSSPAEASEACVLFLGPRLSWK